MLTANGRIRCLRCTARSTRSGQQCGRPALKSSRTQKCQFHGGRSTGPKTLKGRRRIAAAHTVHGRDARLAREERSAVSVRISRLVDAARVLGMIGGAKTRGRKAAGYVPVRTLDDVLQMIRDDLSARCGGPSRG
jgi:hypothetical protein